MCGIFAGQRFELQETWEGTWLLACAAGEASRAGADTAWVSRRGRHPGRAGGVGLALRRAHLGLLANMQTLRHHVRWAADREIAVGGCAHLPREARLEVALISCRARHQMIFWTLRGVPDRASTKTLARFLLLSSERPPSKKVGPRNRRAQVLSGGSPAQGAPGSPALHSQPCTLNPTPSTPHPQSCTLNLAPSTLHHQPYTVNPPRPESARPESGVDCLVRAIFARQRTSKSQGASARISSRGKPRTVHPNPQTPHPEPASGREVLPRNRRGRVRGSRAQGREA